MTAAVTLVNTTTDTFQVLINRLNQMANLMSNSMVTVSQTSGGSATSGNAAITGVFQIDTVTVPTALRGGTLAVPAVLPVTSNVNIGSGNVLILTTGVVNAASIGLGANVLVDSTKITIGNTTVNVQANSTTVVIGGSNAATVANRSAVGTFTNGKLNFIAGTGASITVTNDAVGGQINVQINAASASVSTPGGSTTQVQINDGGTLTGFAGLTFDKTSNNLFVANTSFAATTALDSGGVTRSASAVSTAGTTAQLVDSWSASTFRTAFYDVVIKNGSANGFATHRLTLLYDGSDCLLSDFDVMQSNGAIGVFTANVNATTMRLYFTPVPLAANVRLSRTLLAI